MFGIGDYVFYSSGGICKVCDIVPCPIPKLLNACDYYLLKSVHDTKGEMFVPTTLNGVFMRPIIEKSEAEKLLSDFLDIPRFEEPNAKRLREKYNEAMRSHLPSAWISVIKTVYYRIKASNKPIKISDTERSIYENAKKFLNTELSLVLDMPYDDVAKEIKILTEK